MSDLADSMEVTDRDSVTVTDPGTNLGESWESPESELGTTWEGPETTVDGRPRCQEPGCERGCRKRRNSDEFLPYCSMHNSLHAGESSGATPKSQSPQRLQEAKKRSAQKIAQNVTGWGAMVQTGLLANGDRYCAFVLGQEVPPIASALGDLAQEFPLLKKALESGDKYGTLSLLVFHMVKLGAAIGAHHNLVPYEGVIKFLVPPPPGTPEAARLVAEQQTVNGHGTG